MFLHNVILIWVFFKKRSFPLVYLLIFVVLMCSLKAVVGQLSAAEDKNFLNVQMSNG